MESYKMRSAKMRKCKIELRIKCKFECAKKCGAKTCIKCENAKKDLIFILIFW